MLRPTGLRPHPLLCSYKNLGNPQVPSSSLHISLPQEIVFLQATFHGTNREYSYPNKEYIDLIFVSLIVFLIDKYHKTISPESEVYNIILFCRPCILTIINYDSRKIANFGRQSLHIFFYYKILTQLVQEKVVKSYRNRERLRCNGILIISKA